ncbi:MAG: radical SAM protein [Bacteroidetes bacterium]|nr:radical SAM protein [Bacteroidota bacterium]
MELKRIIIKPTILCTADCVMCVNRQDLYKKFAIAGELTLVEWCDIIDNADRLGCKVVIISGGEPLLYKELPELVSYIKSKDMLVVINTSGHGYDKNLLKMICNAGVDDLSIPLYSNDEDIHDGIRKTKGAFFSAIETIDFISKECPDTKINSQYFLSKLNYRCLSEVLNLCIKLKINKLDFTYIEGDFNHENLLNATELTEYISEVIPKVTNVIAPYVDNYREIIDKLISLHGTSVNYLSKGIYQPGNTLPCKRPSEALLILCNGDVLPCNMIEYTNQRIAGNIKDSTLTEIWTGTKLNLFRDTNFPICRMCSLPLYTKIKFTYYDI